MRSNIIQDTNQLWPLKQTHIHNRSLCYKTEKFANVTIYSQRHITHTYKVGRGKNYLCKLFGAQADQVITHIL